MEEDCQKGCGQVREPSANGSFLGEGFLAPWAGELCHSQWSSPLMVIVSDGRGCDVGSKNK